MASIHEANVEPGTFGSISQHSIQCPRQQIKFSAERSIKFSYIGSAVHLKADSIWRQMN